MAHRDAETAPSPRIPPGALARTGGLAGWDATVAWSFVPERVTWRLRSPRGEVGYLKVAPLGEAPGLADEAQRMRWLGPRLVVPRVLDYGSDGAQEWLLTAAIDGISAVDPTLRADPRRLVPLLAEGLRRFHAVPWADCPFDDHLDPMHPLVHQRFAAGRTDPDTIRRNGGRTDREALRYLETSRPQPEELVLCHGDYCVPNVLLRAGRVAGFVDLGRAGVGDRWQDLTDALWSVTRNLGAGWEDLFLEGYGVRRDPQRLAYYRLLHDLLP